MPNGCGMFGEVSRLYKLRTGDVPPFEACCLEHDLAYEQCESEEDRVWADKHFERCMAANGYQKLGKLFFVLVRYFGWIAALRHRVTRDTADYALVQ